MLRRARTAAILTAAGASTRMGSPKALLRASTDGPTLIEQQLSHLHGFHMVVVVTGAYPLTEVLPPHVRAVHNADWQAGRQSSIACAAEAVAAIARDALDAVLIAAVDQPLSARVIDALLGAIDPGLFARPIAPTHGDRGGHPLVVPAAALDALVALRDAPEGLRTLLARTGKDRLPLPYPEVLLDLNRPEDWRAAVDDGIIG